MCLYVHLGKCFIYLATKQNAHDGIWRAKILDEFDVAGLLEKVFQVTWR